jgi:lipopolysaccharide transport system ATP-binding protein
VTRPAILVEDVGVRFRPYVDRKPTLRKSVANRRTRQQEEVVALDHVSFRVEKGEAFGVVGHNGAGKSTLLRVMARTLKPNSGRVVVNGRASTLLQLGVGFNPELSGNRNIYLGGLAAGLRKGDIDVIFDDIVEYAGLDDAIDRPVKTYSSGMFARLAFSVSMHLDPDILLLDEVLAVGDAEFREKSMGTMKELLERSGTIVFVSHALPQVADFCDRAMWLAHGRVQMIGEAGEVVAAYKRNEQVHKERRRRATEPAPSQESVG